MLISEVLAQPFAKRFFVARFITNYGNGMSPIALAFGILALPNGSANLLGLVLGFTTAMFVVMAPFGGVIADKYGRARVVGLTDMAAGAVLLIQVVYFLTGQVPVAVLLLVNGCYGLLWGIFWPAFTGIMPTIVPKEGLQEANAINALMTNSGLVLGAASAGFLIDIYGAAITLGIDAATFLLSGIMVFTLRHLDNMTRDLEKWWVNERKSRVPSIDEAATVVARVMSRHLGCERLVEDMVDAEIAGVIRFEIGGGNSAQ